MSQSSEFSSFPSELLTKDDQTFLLEDVMQNWSTNNPLLPEDMLNYVNAPVATTPNILSNEDYPGPYNFEVSICPNGSKNPWVYSPKLNKIFMDMCNPFPVDFKIQEWDQDLFIRATPVFSLPQHSQEFVSRCICHEHQLDPTNKDVPEQVRSHIIRCKNPEVVYIGDKTNMERLSLVVPLSIPQTGSDSVREMFEFVCKNSCPGINRRPIEVIFTLEDAGCNILGRRVLLVRICSCPKRDKEKEENDDAKVGNPKSGSKKRKLEKTDKKNVVGQNSDTKEYTLSFNIVGKHNAQLVYKLCHDLMAGEIIKHPNNDAPYRKCIQNLNYLMSKSLD